jgi:cytochrome c peroxidase
MRKSVVISILLSLGCFQAIVPEGEKTVELGYPKSWPKPQYDFEANPLTEAKIELGRKLFYDPILSKDNMVSCANCHLSYTAFTHVDHALSHGIGDSVGIRNSMTLVNMAWSKHFMWDGAINNIEVQALAPISHEDEMGEEIGSVLNKLQDTPNYPRLFGIAFGDTTINSKNMLKAMAQFQLTFVSANSKYDQVKAGTAAFTAQEEAGFQLFKAKCAGCHTEPLFTSGDFANNGLLMDSNLMDVGRYGVTKRRDDSLKFKIPSLRNVEFSQPYMHDGRFKSLHQVLKHYSNGIHTSRTLDAKLAGGLNLSEDDRLALVAFMLTLTDKEFLFNPKLSYPRN